ncbi:helix-turn-helix domain-containing protein [Methylobacterium sp. WL103]|uniref:helix-turn-helix domain-containing protein n=1 Tax=Methylobacterium sp. WL103 TaxID=2603891 RepID=UPI001650729A|nr:helix-turn-helix domain-containing protein [Methylobacterium sp. WL103]
MEWLDAVLAGRPRMPPTTFTVAFVVARHWNGRDREAWPSQRRMMLLTGVSETTLRASLRTLIDRGYLEQAKRGVRNGNKYRLCRPEAAVTSV